MPTPTHWEYLTAFLEMLDDGGSVNYAELARRLAITRHAVWKMFEKTPGFEAWINDRLGDAMSSLVGGVMRRMGSIALRTGSPKHAEIYLKATKKLTDRTEVTGKLTLEQAIQASRE